MMIASALKLLSDVLFYMTFAGSIGAMLGGSNIILALPFFAVAILLSSWLSNRGSLKYAPMVLLVGAYFAVPFHLANILVLTPACIYAITAIPSPEDNVKEYDYTRIFRLFIYIFIPFFVMFFVLKQRYALSTTAVPIGLAFVSASILLMRMLRHDEAVLRERKFMVRNLLSVAGIIVLSLALGSQTFFAFLRSMLAFMYTKFIVPILMYSIMGIIYVFSWIISLFTSGEARSFKKDPLQLNLMLDMSYSEDLDEVRSGIGGQIFDYVMYTLAAALVIFLIIRIFKALSRKSIADARQASYNETRSNIDVPKAPKVSRRSPDGRVREIYRRFLLLCNERGMGQEPHYTSSDVARISSIMFNKPQESQQLRDIYIKVRYAEENPSASEIKNAKALYDTFKKDSSAE